MRINCKLQRHRDLGLALAGETPLIATILLRKQSIPFLSSSKSKALILLEEDRFEDYVYEDLWGLRDSVQVLRKVNTILFTNK